MYERILIISHNKLLLNFPHLWHSIYASSLYTLVAVLAKKRQSLMDLRTGLLGDFTEQTHENNNDVYLGVNILVFNSEITT